MFKVTNKWAKGTKYGPLLSDSECYLCPDCGGYGLVPDKNDDQKECLYCMGEGTIRLEDHRVL